jgi:carbonic anhydrase/acetyltransferase-like protein (isoleucine patch superfamily)
MRRTRSFDAPLIPDCPPAIESRPVVSEKNECAALPGSNRHKTELNLLRSSAEYASTQATTDMTAAKIHAWQGLLHSFRMVTTSCKRQPSPSDQHRADSPHPASFPNRLPVSKAQVTIPPPMPLFTRHPDGSFRSHNCSLVGDISAGDSSSFWFNAVVRGDVAAVVIGQRTNVQDNATVHCDSGVPNLIGNDVVIGHNAIVHGKSVGDGSLIGMGAIVLGQSVIGKGCLIAAGAVVPPGLVVPDGMVVMGVPGKIVRPVKPQEIEYMRWLSAHYVELAQKYVRGDFEWNSK